MTKILSVQAILNFFAGFPVKMSDCKWVTEADDYVCPLSAETQKVAKEELREDEQSRQTALECMRDWIRQNPKIKNCRLGNFFDYNH